MTLLIKLSGEALGGADKTGLDFDYINEICLRIKEIHDRGINVGIVCGGGNFLRGRNAKEMNRETADYVGMFATIMNSLVLADTLNKQGVDTYNQSGLSVSCIDDIDSLKAVEAINDGKIVVFGGGIGKPYFSTDTAASMRAVDINADVIVKLTNVDGVYDKDPNKYEDAKMYDDVTFDEVINNNLEIMDMSAIKICKDNNINIVVCNINDKDCLNKIINGDKIGTKVSM